jgi:hypothetical protein
MASKIEGFLFLFTISSIGGMAEAELAVVVRGEESLTLVVVVVVVEVVVAAAVAAATEMRHIS